MIHITLPQLCAYLDDELAESSAELVRRHLSDCLECTERFGRLEEQDELLVRILSDEPEEEFFQALSASIPLDTSTDGERRAATSFDAPSAGPSAKKRGKGKPSKKSEPAAKSSAKATPTPGTPTPAAKPIVNPAPTPVVAAAVTPPVAPPPVVASPPVAPPPVVAAPEPVAESAPMAEIDAEPISEPATAVARPRAERPTPVRRDRKPAPTPRRRAEDFEPAFSMRTAAIVVIVCVVLGASIAWVATRPRGAASNPPAPATVPAQEAPSAEAPSTSDAGPTPEELLERSSEPPADSSEPVIDEPEPVAATSPEPEPQEVAPERPASTSDARKAPSPKPRAPEPAPERLVERAPKNFVPVQTVITQTIVAPPASSESPATPKPARTVAQPDPAAAAVRAAKSASLEAARTKLPVAFDKSADAWERTLPLLETAPETLATARREWAQARFQAWAAEPTPARRDAAIASARQYLLYAPPGPERDQAWTWLGRLKH